MCSSDLPEQFVAPSETLHEIHTETAAGDTEHSTPDLQPEAETENDSISHSKPNSYVETASQSWLNPDAQPEPEPVPELIAEPAPEPLPEPEPVAEVSAVDELAALKSHVADGVLQWLSSSSMNAHASWLRESGASRDPEKFKQKLLDQVNAICDHAWSVHTGQSPTLPNTFDSAGSLTGELQKWAIAQAASRLTRSLDIRAALEVNGPFDNLIQDRKSVV